MFSVWTSDDPQDLSQKLLDDDAPSKAAGNMTKELTFTEADEDSISTALVVKKA